MSTAQKLWREWNTIWNSKSSYPLRTRWTSFCRRCSAQRSISRRSLSGTRSCRGIEVREVAKQVPARVPDPAVRFGQMGQDLLGDPDVVAVVGRRDPEPEHLGPVLVDHFLRRDHVARGFAHLLARAVHGKAMGQDRIVRRPARRGNGGKERRLEPAPVLVAPFKVQVRGPGKFLHAASARPHGSRPNRTTRRGCPSPSRSPCCRTSCRP